MELKPAPELRLHRPAERPLHHAAEAKAAALKRAGTGFEALLIGRMLATAARPSPFAGPLSAGGAEIMAETNRMRAEALAASAPLGVAKLLQAEAK